MKHTLLCLVFSAAVATAQQSDPTVFRDQVALLAAPPSADTASLESPQAGASTKPAAKEKAQPKPTTPPESSWPSSDPSDVGYIDNAVVRSEVRTRVDAAFNDQFPDRAEFIYGKCGCYRDLQNSSASDPNAPGPGPLKPTGIPAKVNFQVLSFMAEYAPKGNRRFSGFVEIPYRWLQPQGVAQGSPPTCSSALTTTCLPALPAFPNGSVFANSFGIGDIELGLKFALLASPKRYLTAQLKTYFPSGSAREGLGTNHYSLEPALLYYQQFSHKFQLEGELGGWLPIGGSAGLPPNVSQSFAGNIFFYGIGPSYRVVDHEQFKLAPVIELIGWSVTGGFETGGTASGTNIVNLKVGARMSFHTRNSVYVGYGFPLTSADWYNDILRVEYRYSF